MPTFRLTSPDGLKVDVTGDELPDIATADAIFEQARAKTQTATDLSRVSGSPYERADVESMSAGYGKSPTGMEAGTEFTESIVREPSQIPSMVMGAAMAPFGAAGSILNSAVQDAMATVTGHPSYGGNIYEFFKRTSPVESEEKLPYEETLKATSETDPAKAFAGHLASGLIQSAPIMAAGLPQGAAGRLIALGFTADMIRGAGHSATVVGEEMGKNPEDRDKDRITKALSEMTLSGVFAPLMAAHVGKGVSEDITGIIPRGTGIASPPPRRKGIPYARRQQEAAEVYGDVRPQPIEGQRQVPLEEGGARVQPLEARPSQPPGARESEVLLSPEATDLLERSSIDHPVEVVSAVADADQPFSTLRQRRAKAGHFAYFNPETGKVEIIAELFNRALGNVSPRLRQRWVQSVLNQEQIHIEVDRNVGAEGTSSYWRDLSDWEQSLERRIYLGESGSGGFSTSQLGHEAMRRRIELARGLTPMEFLDLTLKERWTARSLDALSRILRSTREGLGTEAARRQRQVFDKAIGNVVAAKAAAQQREDESPAASERQEEMLNEKDVTAASEFAKLRAVAQQTAAGRRFARQGERELRRQAEVGEPMPGDEGPAAMQRGTKHPDEVARDTIEKLEAESARLRSSGKIRDANELQGQAENMKRGFPGWNQESFPAAFQRGKRKENVPLGYQEGGLFKGQPSTGSGDIAEHVSPSEAGAMPRMTALDLQRHAQGYIDSTVSSESRPSFREFSDWAKRNMHGSRAEQLRSLWEDTVWDHLMKASPERLAQWRQALGLEKKFGAREIQSPQPEGFRLEREFHEGKRAATRVRKEESKVTEARSRYRSRIISEVAQTLLREAMPDDVTLDRKSVSLDDIDFDNAGAAHDPWREISKSESGSPLVLGEIFKDQARRSSRDPVSWTKNLVVMLNKRTGEVEVVSAYPHGRSGVMATEPGVASVKMRPNRPLSEMLRTYQPIYRILLKEPVRNFHEHFGSIEDFNSKLGREGNNLARAAQYAEFAGERPPEGDPRRLRFTGREGEGEAPLGMRPEDIDAIEGTPGLRGEGGSVTGPEADIGRAEMGLESGRGTRSSQPLTASEASALMDTIEKDVGKLDDLNDMREGLNELAYRNENRKLSGRDWSAIAALHKATRVIRRANPDWTAQRVADRVLDTFYENYKTAKSYEEYVQRALEQFGRPSRPAPGGGTTPEVQGSPTAREITQRRSVAPTTLRPAHVPPGVYPNVTTTPPVPATARPGPSRSTAYLPEELRRESPAAPVSEGYAAIAREPLQYARPAGGPMERVGKGVVPRRPVRDAPQGPVGGVTGLPLEEGPAATMRGVKKALKKVRPGITEAIRSTGSAYEEWMVDRIGRAGGPVSKQASDGFRHIVDRAKELYGSLTPVLDPARKAAGKMGGGTIWLHGRENVTPFAATRRTVGAIEGTLPVPPEAQATVDLAKAANLEIGKMLQTVIPGFVASGKFARNITGYGYDVIRQGRGDAWQKWTAGVSRANKVGISRVRDFFREWKEVLDEPGADVATIEKVNQDFARQFPSVITDIKSGGAWQQVVHADLFNYLENAAQRAAHIRAFREQFPNTTAGRTVLNDLMEDIRSELGPSHQKDLDSMLRTMQGHPTDNYSSWGILSPTEKVGQAFRMMNQTIGNVMAKAVLTGQMFVQPGETFAGSVPVFLGYKNYLRGLARFKQLYPQLEQQGAVNRVMYDFSFDPSSPVRSVFRWGGNAMSKTFMEQLLNELQEGSAAATARVVTERIETGRLSDWEKRMLPETFRTMGFPENDVHGLMLGDPALLRQFERKAAAFLTSGNKAVSESSRLGANRLFNSIFRFQSYPMMKTQQFRRVASRLAEAWESGGRPEERRAATEQFARFLFGNAMQGALTVAITSLFYQGFQGLKIRGEEAEDDPVKFLTEAFGATMSGPIYLLMRGSQGKGILGFGENATRMIFPWAVMKELLDMSQGAGPYKDLDTFDRIGKFLSRKTPGTKAIGTGLSLVGLSNEDKALDASISAFYRWRRDTLGFSEQEDYLKEDERKEFRTAMRKAVEALKSGDEDKFQEAYSDAFYEAGDKPKQRVAASFKGRKILRTPEGKPLTPDQRDALEEHIGNEAFSRLEYFDLMMDWAAKGIQMERGE